MTYQNAIFSTSLPLGARLEFEKKVRRLTEAYALLFEPRRYIKKLRRRAKRGARKFFANFVQNSKFSLYVVRVRVRVRVFGASRGPGSGSGSGFSECCPGPGPGFSKTRLQH